MGFEMALIGATAGIGAAGSIMQGISEKNAQDANAQMLKEQASSERAQASAKITQDDYEALQVMGRTSAMAGAAGVTQTGSVEQIQNQSKEQATINDMYTRYSGRLAAMKSVYSARQATYQGQQALAAGVMGAVGSLTGGGMEAYKSTKLGSDSSSDRSFKWDWS